MFKTSYEVESFQMLMSDKLGINFAPRKSNPHFLVNIEAFPEKTVNNNELFFCLKECLNVMGVKLDESSIKTSDSFTWVKMEKGEGIFSLGITNSQTPYPRVIITITQL